jgi:hypothetical protein
MTLKPKSFIETWIPFDECPHFIISNTGRLINTRTNHERKLSALSGGYRGFTLFRGTKGYRMHDCVARHFVNKPLSEEKLVVNHKDFDKTNNNAWNLEWITAYENMQYSKNAGRITKGSRRYGAKLNELQVSIIKEAYEKGYTNCSHISRYFKVQNATIYNICIGKKWVHVKSATCNIHNH